MSAQHPAYAGHFPQMPVLPGAVLIDAAIAAIGAECGELHPNYTIVAAKFLRPVRPGDALAVEHVITPDGAIRFTVHAGEDAVLTALLRMHPS